MTVQYACNAALSAKVTATFQLIYRNLFVDLFGIEIRFREGRELKKNGFQA
jgi:hypothetical protein